MRTRTFIVIIGLLTCVLSARAQQFQVDELWYEVTGKRNVQVLADPTDTAYRQLTSVVVPAKVVYEGKEYNVTRLDDQAFRYCHLMQSISLPESLREIGFQTFMNCTQLREIRLPQSLRKLDEMVFYGCASLENVYVGKRIGKWSEMCFSDCQNLKTIYHANSRPPKAKRMTFFNCPDSITYYRAK